MKVTAALVRVYIANGNRGDRKKARLKHLLETWSLEKYLEETEKLLGYKLLRTPADQKLETRNSELGTPPHSHVGVFPQKQKGLNYIGVAIPVGQITPKQMLRLAEIADLYGSSEVRLTVWQNLIIPNVPDAWHASHLSFPLAGTRPSPPLRVRFSPASTLLLTVMPGGPVGV